MSNKYKISLKIIIVYLMLSFVPLAVLSFYNHPAADDYSYGKWTHQIWLSSSSLWQTLKEAVHTSVHFWNSCDGLYASAFFMSLQPAIFGEKYYALTAFITMGSMLFANLFFGHIVLHKIIRISTLESVYCSVIATFMMIQWMPSGVQGIYWYDGSMNYTCFFAFFMMMLTMSIYTCKSIKLKEVIKRSVVTSLLALLLAGGNHVTAFAGILYLFGIAGYQFAKKKKYSFFCGGLPLIAIISGFVFNITSPGTSARQTAFTERYGVVKTIFAALIRGLNYINDWFGLDTVICLILLLPVFYKIVLYLLEQGFRFSYPVFVIILSVGFNCALLSPPYYAMGVEGEGRLTNVIYYMYVALLLFDTMYIFGWIITHIKIKENKNTKKISILTNMWIPICLCGTMLLLGGIDTHGYEAFRELMSGEAREYNRENCERADFLENTDFEDVFVTPFSVYPELLYFDDITYDINDWRNRAMAYYYGLNSVQKYDYMGQAIW